MNSLHSFTSGWSLADRSHETTRGIVMSHSAIGTATMRPYFVSMSHRNPGDTEYWVLSATDHVAWFIAIFWMICQPALSKPVQLQHFYRQNESINLWFEKMSRACVNLLICKGCVKQIHSSIHGRAQTNQLIHRNLSFKHAISRIRIVHTSLVSFKNTAASADIRLLLLYVYFLLILHTIAHQQEKLKTFFLTQCEPLISQIKA